MSNKFNFGFFFVNLLYYLVLIMIDLWLKPDYNESG